MQRQFLRRPARVERSNPQPERKLSDHRPSAIFKLKQENNDVRRNCNGIRRKESVR